MVINTIIAALYVALTGIFAFMSFGAVQFRVSEMLNHLVATTKITNTVFWRVFLSPI